MLNNPEALQEYPFNRIKPMDGMAVTAEVWEEAHDYHRQQLQNHALFAHGPGIVTGLEVIASDPPDTAVYVLPGIALDPSGHTIVVIEPTAYDIGRTADGMLYLLLSYGEGRPRPGPNGDGEGAPLYVRGEFVIEAATAAPDFPHVELARVLRKGRTTPILDPADPAHPGVNEIDQRSRRDVGPKSPTVAQVAVVFLGGEDSRHHRRGIDNLARAASRYGNLRVNVDFGVPLDEEIQKYRLIYLVGLGSFNLNSEQMNALYAFAKGGNTVFYEGNRRDIETGDPPADTSFRDMLNSMGIQLQEIAPDHRLQTQPNFFAALPAGFEEQGAPDIRLGGGFIFSAEDYGSLWAGERRGGVASREAIRSALEWGENLLAFALERREATTVIEP